MKNRCSSPSCPNYPYYGGRGIRFHPEWAEFGSFLRDVGLRPTPQHSLDRIDNDGNYEPGNVRWATRKVQGRNKSSNVRLTAFGETLTAKEWAERKGLKYLTLLFRLRRGMPTEEALSMPTLSHSQCGKLAHAPNSPVGPTPTPQPTTR